ncbi:MAG: polysaccharide deacetylase [Acidimicrobiales bacterium]|nr:polysaccharide deacetylase [Acidimicrobiales bacterium]
MTTRRLAAWLGASAAAAYVAHAAPALTSSRPLRTRWLPGLAGIGRPGHVALTFDDGPDPASTPEFLATLDRLGITATFFMLGSMVRRAPGLAAEVAAAGHEVAVHGDEHRYEIARSPWAVADDLARAFDAVAAATGRTPRFSRPPYGVLSTAGLLAARRLALEPVLWTAWGRDWRAEATARSVAGDVERDLAPGGTVLLHDSDCTSAPGSWRSALGALPLLAERWAAAGLVVGPLADHGLAA